MGLLQDLGVHEAEEYITSFPILIKWDPVVMSVFFHGFPISFNSCSCSTESTSLFFQLFSHHIAYNSNSMRQAVVVQYYEGKNKEADYGEIVSSSVYYFLSCYVVCKVLKLWRLWKMCMRDVCRLTFQFMELINALLNSVLHSRLFESSIPECRM